MCERQSSLHYFLERLFPLIVLVREAGVRYVPERGDGVSEREWQEIRRERERERERWFTRCSLGHLGEERHTQRRDEQRKEKEDLLIFG